MQVTNVLVLTADNQTRKKKKSAFSPFMWKLIWIETSSLTAAFFKDRFSLDEDIIHLFDLWSVNKRPSDWHSPPLMLFSNAAHAAVHSV